LDNSETSSDFSSEQKQSAKKDIVLPCNLNIAAVQLKTMDFRGCIKSCGEVLKIDSTSSKGLYRRAQACKEIKDYELGIKDLQRCLEYDANNKEASALLAQCQKLLKAEEAQQKRLYSKMFA